MQWHINNKRRKETHNRTSGYWLLREKEKEKATQPGTGTRLGKLRREPEPNQKKRKETGEVKK